MTCSRVFQCITIALFFVSSIATAQSPRYNKASYDLAKKRWVDSVYNSLNDAERIGQLFMVAAYSGGKDYNQDKITALINAHQIGGLIFMQGTAEAQAEQTNQYQQMAQVPLLIGMDAEWGLGMRLTGVKNLSHSMLIGATHDTLLAYRVGAAVAAQCKRLGVHIDFAPVVDVNNNPDNPIINARSYGEDKKWVAKLGIAYMKGLQDNGVMACAKHFPGHGDTKTDSHQDLPVINKSLQELDTLELYPFQRLINAGIKSVMVAHLSVPALEATPNIPTTLSNAVVTDLLKERMGFKGLVFTDALNMQGVAKFFPAGEVDLRAFLAGNDVLLFSQDVPTGIAKIKAAVDSGLVTHKDLEIRVRKILAAKYDAGLSRFHPLNSFNATADVNKLTSLINTKVAEGGVTLVRDRNNIIQQLTDRTKRIGYIAVNAYDTTVLSNALKNEIDNIHIQYLPRGRSNAYVNALMDTMTDNDITIVGVHNMSFYPGGGNYGLDDQQISFLTQLQTRPNVMIVLLGNAYWLRNLCNAGSLLVGYEDDNSTEDVAARILLHQADPKGSLPVTPCPDMTTEGRPVLTAKPTQVKGAPLSETIFSEDAGVVNSQVLDKLNLFIQRSIVDGAFPGCRILAAKDGKVFYNQSFGYYTFAKDTPVTLNTIYDVASVTKVLSTTLAVMRLYETGKLDIDKRIGDYLPWARNSDKSALVVRDLLLHQAGLKSWIPFFKETLNDKSNPRPEYYSHTPDEAHGIEVAKNLYIRNDYRDSIWQRILNSPLENKGRYVYSDLDFYFLAAIVEQISGQRLDKYVDEQFYKPMGLKHIGFNPLNKFNAKDIAPTALEIRFRHQLLKGYVHDPGSAMFGGVAGHAGIFATADDVAAIFQMLLNKGSYKGKSYFKKGTVEYFTAYHSTISRRGLGFDKPTPDEDDAGPAGNRCSGYAFGHQGFTGTCVWADPQTGIVFVFLSNRVNPSEDNNLINKLSVRTMAQDYIYEALGYPINTRRDEVYKTQLNLYRK